MVAILGAMWMISFPYTAEDVFTSENALKGDFLSSLFKRNPKIKPTFDTLKSKIDPLQTPAELKQFVLEFMSSKAETHT